MFKPEHLKAARIVHAANNSLRFHFGDPANPVWDELDEESKHRALVGVAKVAESPDITPQQCHAMWVESMAADGYRYGDNIDYVRKEHPNMVPYSQLPEPQKLKDLLFISIVKEACGAP